MRFLRSILQAAIPGLLVLMALAGTPATRAADRPGPARAQPVRPATSGTARRPLPDSVLLRLNGREDVTLRRFERAVRLLGGRPDSLTPGDRDRFLELVVEQRLLAARATRDPRPWPPAESAQFRLERDNILLRAALADRFTQLERRRQALGQPDLDETAMGVAARESLMLEIEPKWNGELLKVVGSYFAELPQPTATMSPREQLALAAMSPKIPAAETLKVLARSKLGEFTVAELLADWRRLSSVYRPRVRDDEGVKALVQNSLFERVVREAATRPALAQRSEVAAVIADRIEYHAVTTFLQRDLLSGIRTDSLTLERYYRAHRSDFDQPARASLVLLTLGDERAADSVAKLMAVPGEAESLALRAQRSGVRYTHMATETGDSALYRRAAGVGAGGVDRPLRVEGGWRVFKVLALEPKTPQPLGAVRPQVERAWREVESERLLRRLLDSLKKAARVERNEAVLRRLVTSRTSGK